MNRRCFGVADRGRDASVDHEPVEEPAAEEDGDTPECARQPCVLDGERQLCREAVLSQEVGVERLVREPPDHLRARAEFDDAGELAPRLKMPREADGQHDVDPRARGDVADGVLDGDALGDQAECGAAVDADAERELVVDAVAGGGAEPWQERQRARGVEGQRLLRQWVRHPGELGLQVRSDRELALISPRRSAGDADNDGDDADEGAEQGSNRGQCTTRRSRERGARRQRSCWRC